MGSRHWPRFSKPPGHANDSWDLSARAVEEERSYEAAIPGQERRAVPSSLTNARMSLTEEEPRPWLVPALSPPRLGLQGPATTWTGGQVACSHLGHSR